MKCFEWNDDLETGHAEIDAQHRLLVVLGKAMVDSLISPKGGRANTADLRALIEFTKEHFEYEEMLMRSSAYPAAERHAKYHASLLTEIRSYCRRVERSVHTDPEKLAGFVWDWIRLHINAEDRDLVMWLEAHESDHFLGKVIRALDGLPEPIMRSSEVPGLLKKPSE